jgi:hypothetical protein
LCKAITDSIDCVLWCNEGDLISGHLIREFKPNRQIRNSCHVSIATGILVLSPAPCQNPPDSRSRRSMLLQQKDAISHPRDFCPSFFSKKKPVPMSLAGPTRTANSDPGHGPAGATGTQARTSAGLPLAVPAPTGFRVTGVRVIGSRARGGTLG